MNAPAGPFDCPRLMRLSLDDLLAESAACRQQSTAWPARRPYAHELVRRGMEIVNRPPARVNF